MCIRYLKRAVIWRALWIIRSSFTHFYVYRPGVRSTGTIFHSITLLISERNFSHAFSNLFKISSSSLDATPSSCSAPARQDCLKADRQESIFLHCALINWFICFPHSLSGTPTLPRKLPRAIEIRSTTVPIPNSPPVKIQMIPDTTFPM